MNEKELLNRLSELPREIPPARDPWPEISARIDSSQPGARVLRAAPAWMFRAVAASVLLFVIAGLLLKPAWQGGQQPLSEVAQQGDVPKTDQLEQVRYAVNPGLRDAIDAEYLAAFREYINVGGPRGNLPEQAIEKIETSWSELRVTETALVAALEQNPGNLFLNERMLELRARQLGFLKQLATIDRNNRRMTI